MTKQVVDLLVIAPLHDIPTSTSFQAGKHLIEWAKEEGFSVRSLTGASALRGFLWNELKKYNFRIISYFGHGGEDRLFGFYPPGDLVQLDNVVWLRNNIVNTMACLSAKELGPYAHNHGVTAYFGSDVLMYGAFKEPEHDYLADWIDCETTIPKVLLRGGTFGEALIGRKSKYSTYISIYERHMKEWDSADWYIQSFTSNRDRYYLLGDPEETLPEEIKKEKEVVEVPEDIIGEIVKAIKNIGREAFGSFVIGTTLLATTVAPIVADIAVKEAKKRGWIK